MVAAAVPVKRAPQVQLRAEKTWRPTLTSEADFMKLSKKVGDERFVKAILDVREGGGIYFFDVNVYNVHIDFAFREFYTEALTPARRAAFSKNYGADKPDFMLVTLVNHVDSDIWTFSFWEGDKMSPAHVVDAHKRLSTTFFMGPKLRFRPASPRQERMAKKLTAVPHITNDSLYKLTSQHTFNAGRRVGILRLVKKGKSYDQLSFKPNEIVILQEPIPEITAVSGIISEQFSTPLAHVNLRAASWGIPHIGLRKASRTYAKLVGKPVLLHAKPGGFELRLATKDEASLISATGAPAGKIAIPRADLTRTQLGWLPEIRKTMTPIFGAKAANLGEIAFAKIPGVRVPLGFAVPIAHYAAHMKKSGLDKAVTKLLADKAMNSDATHRRVKLAELRKSIEAAPIDPKLAAEVARRVIQLKLKAGKGVFVRSSTNAEDLPGFTGAGLYTTVPNVQGDAAINAAIKTVWASIWNYRAFEERRYQGIDHTAVYAGVLVQTGINATAAGVLITTNIFDPSDTGTYTINAKSGLGMRVVGGKKIPEQLLYSPASRSIKVLSRSDETTMLVFDEAKGGVKEVPTPAGQSVLSDQRILELGHAAEAVSKLFAGVKAIDIEWLVEGNIIHIVQARPFVTR